LTGEEFESLKSDIRKTIRTIKSYRYHAEQEFAREIDYFHLRGQDNILRYLPVGTVVVRLHAQDNLFETLARIAAVKITGCRLIISIPRGMQTAAARFLDEKEGRIERLQYCRQQSICHTDHRYGTLGERAVDWA
jgi:RHH-type proline utilization regulon transcriptional repressor/proline dehydrogenase/delta 1-pyrroline-5-carboxylate dehydrogenase